MFIRPLALSIAAIIVVSFVVVTHFSLAQSGPAIISGKFYRFDVIAAAG